MKYFFTISLGLACLVACVDMDHEQSEERDMIVAQGVDIRLDDFRKREWEKCQAKALDRAIQLADSTIRARARQEAIEPIAKPPKPERPLRPLMKTIPDSTGKSMSTASDTLQF